VTSVFGENGQPGGCVVSAHGEMELRVVGVLLILYAVLSDDVGDWAAVDCRPNSDDFATKHIKYKTGNFNFIIGRQPHVITTAFWCN